MGSETSVRGKERGGRICPFCKEQTDIGSRVCKHCGSLLESDETAHFKAKMRKDKQMMSVAGMIALGVVVAICLAVILWRRGDAEPGEKPAAIEAPR